MPGGYRAFGGTIPSIAARLSFSYGGKSHSSAGHAFDVSGLMPLPRCAAEMFREPGEPPPYRLLTFYATPF